MGVKHALEQREKKREEEETKEYGKPLGKGGKRKRVHEGGSDVEIHIDMEDVQVALRLLGFLCRMHVSSEERWV